MGYSDKLCKLLAEVATRPDVNMSWRTSSSHGERRRLLLQHAVQPAKLPETLIDPVKPALGKDYPTR